MKISTDTVRTYIGALVYDTHVFSTCTVRTISGVYWCVMFYTMHVYCFVLMCSGVLVYTEAGNFCSVNFCESKQKIILLILFLQCEDSYLSFCAFPSRLLKI
jgi:hypothetical protein